MPQFGDGDLPAWELSKQSGKSVISDVNMIVGDVLPA